MAEFRHETGRLVLRDWRDADWPEFWEGTNTPAVMRWLGGQLDVSGMAAARARLEKYQADYGHTFWVVERQDDGAILGFCGLKRCTDENGPFGMPEIGWRLRESAWGQGFAKEAARASLAVGFGDFGFDEIVALTVKGNRASWGLMRALGMRRRPDLDFGQSHWSRGYGKVIVHAIDRDHWTARDG
ncbi:GNAT family N-acetyltransferase [Erythrobacter litoralis]|uniref:GCN5-related N-acetyltransferase n=1 Tax=Erythrobacter litoralis (strain HTCC2594) TaxID=314225 RepID=Q2N6G9_ERYLH|nr:GNAT family N-acetyltransferase [Erythrobacter litoralis]ABC64722.1 GCN5-related N-acetyltransferase [Erythrobacter litoralis HTCC2594]